MKMFSTLLLLPLLPILSVSPSFGSEDNIDRIFILKSIAKDIIALKKEFPQLTDFIVPESFNDEYEISYRYNALDPQGGVGWFGATPHPLDNGVWFYISIHSPQSSRQIHTQPRAVSASIGPYRFQCLLKEGKMTKSLSAALWEIFKNHGVITQEK